MYFLHSHSIQTLIHIVNEIPVCENSLHIHYLFVYKFQKRNTILNQKLNSRRKVSKNYAYFFNEKITRDFALNTNIVQH